jgi:hypothetical protein
MSRLTAYAKFIEQALKYGFSLWGTAKSTQLTSYRTGDDGDFQKGYPETGPRFTDNGDGTITDNATGLMWVKEPGACGGAFGSPGSPSGMTWNNAIDNCLSLDYAGYTDWRLPNIKELMSIADYEKLGVKIDETFFPDTQSLDYWTSTTRVDVTILAWYLYFSDGDVLYQAKTNTGMVRPVRLGIPRD